MQLGRDVMQMPADPALHAGSLDDEVVAVIDQEPDLAGRSVEPGGRQPRFAPRGPRDRERVDRVRLARLAGAATLASHQAGRDPEHVLAGAQQVALQRPGQVPAILQRPPAPRPLAAPRQAPPDVRPGCWRRSCSPARGRARQRRRECAFACARRLRSRHRRRLVACGPPSARYARRCRSGGRADMPQSKD